MTELDANEVGAISLLVLAAVCIVFAEIFMFCLNTIERFRERKGKTKIRNGEIRR